VIVFEALAAMYAIIVGAAAIFVLVIGLAGLRTDYRATVVAPLPVGTPSPEWLAEFSAALEAERLVTS